MRIQLAYKFTGEKEAELLKFLGRICVILNEAGHDTYCPVLNPKRPKDKKSLFLDTLNHLNKADALLALVMSEEKSEGMLMEIGYALGMGKTLFIVIKRSVKNTHLREMADMVIEFDEAEEILDKLGGLR